MSSASGVNGSNANIQLQLLNIAANENVSEMAMEDAKEAEKAKRLEEAEIMANMQLPNAASSEVSVINFNGPEIKAQQQPDLQQASDFLASAEFEEGQRYVLETNIFAAKIFTSQSELLILLRQAFDEARDSQSSVSQRLSDLGSKITESMAERTRDKGFETFSMTVAGSMTTSFIAGASMYSGARNAKASRNETKAFHEQSNINNQARIEQQDALRTMEKTGQAGTPEYQELQNRLELTNTQGKQMQESHEIQRTKHDEKHQLFSGVQNLATVLGGTFNAASSITEAQGQADIDLESTTRDQNKDMRDKANQAVGEIERSIKEALDSIRSVDQAASDLIGSVARNL